MNARRAKAKVLFKGSDISDYVTRFSYTDNTDGTDDISIQLSDRDERWIKDWFPETGDTVVCEIQVFDWYSENDNRSISLGSFEIDNVEFSDSITVNAVSVPITGNARSEKKFRAWEDITLKKVASDIASNAGLGLVFESDFNPYYDKTDQNDKSDLAFLEELCKSDGLCVKITDGQLIIFDESKYDTLPAVTKIMRDYSGMFRTTAATGIIGNPKFRRNAKNIYAACEISYFDSKTDKTYKGSFKAPNVGNVGHVLKLRENFNSKKDDINFDRKAKARLREQNKNEWTADFKVTGDIIYFAGTNTEVHGWHKFDGKYHIKSCTHAIDSTGYSVNLSTRRCLEGY